MWCCACAELLGRLSDGSTNAATASVTASYIEIYQERVTDLLGSGQVVLRGGGELQGAEARPLTSLADAVALLQLGEGRKSRAATAMNQRSSRAHTVFVLRLAHARPASGEKAGGEEGGQPQLAHSQLYLVDLAGAEQLKRSRAVGARKAEAIGINSSLTCLRKCIAALVERRTHVPYLESQLTRLLQPALGGNARTTASP